MTGPTPFNQRSVRDVQRYKARLERAIRERLPQVVANEDLLSAKPDQRFRIRVPVLDEPRFRPQRDAAGGQGSGPGNQPGGESADYTVEIDLTLDELAAWLFESLKLPALKPKGNTMEADRLQLEGVSRRGPMGRLDKKRTLIETLKSGRLSEETVRYRDVRQRQRPVAQAVVAFVRDISASMDEEKRYWVRTAGFWLLQWVKRAYPRTECVFVVHDASAQEVDEHDFFHIERAGGTVISSGLGLCEKILADRYPAKSWNRYVACFSDGDNFPHDDQPARETALRLAAHCERFAYGETHPGTIQSNFMRALSGPSAPPSVRAALITKRDDISGWLQAVFGTDEHAPGPVPARTGEGG